MKYYYCPNCGSEITDTLERYPPDSMCPVCGDYKLFTHEAYEVLSEWEKRTRRPYQDSDPVIYSLRDKNNQVIKFVQCAYSYFKKNKLFEKGHTPLVAAGVAILPEYCSMYKQGLDDPEDPEK